MKKLLLGIVVVIVLVVAVVLATDTPSTPTPSGETPVVAGTMFPVYDIARQIAGGELDVVLVLPPGASPHTFDPSPSTLRQLQTAHVTYAIGHGIDDWVLDLVPENRVEIVDDGITIREPAEHEEEEHHEEESHETDHHDDRDEEEHEEEHDEEDEDEHAHEHGDTDPHYWLDPVNGDLIAQTIASDLSERFPEHAETFSSNLESFQASITNLTDDLSIVRTEIENTNLVTLHDAWYYFADALDLTIAGTFEPTAGREPTPHYLAELTETVEAAQVGTIYSEPQLDITGITSFAGDNNLSIVVLDPLGGTEEIPSYQELILSNANRIAQNQ